MLILIVLILPALRAFAATPIDPDVKKIVAFIFTSKDNVNATPSGTGFFVSVQDTENPSIIYGYLVTAAHVLQDQAGNYHPRVWLRMNSVKGGTDLIAVDLITGGPPFRPESKTVFFHDDPSVDLAVIPLFPDQTTLDYKLLPAETFLPKSKGEFGELKISEGSDVFFTGLFTGFIGVNKNYPIVRFGHVALISDEPIPWGEGHKPPTPTELYLIESTSFGGNSGSPMFFFLGSDRVPGSLVVGAPILKLAGVVKGRFNEAALPSNNSASAIPFENVGISAVVPSYLLYGVLFSNELKEQRSRARANTPRQ